MKTAGLEIIKAWRMIVVNKWYKVIARIVLFVAAIVFCVLGLIGHKEAWAAAALCSFAAVMISVGHR